MWRKSVTTKGTYIEQAHSEECMCRVRETAKFIGSLISEYKIKNSSISGNAMKERLRQKKNCCITRITRKSMENTAISLYSE